MATSVRRDWKPYLLINLPPDLREKVNEEAYELDFSLNEIIRRALCAHYKLRCRVPAGARYRTDLSDRLTIRLQPLLWEKIKADTKGEYGGIKRLIVGVLEEHYEKETPND